MDSLDNSLGSSSNSSVDSKENIPVDDISFDYSDSFEDEFNVSIRTQITEVLEKLKQDLRHLIYPLNHSSKTINLISRQEKFADLYDNSWHEWASERILNKVSGKFDADNLDILKKLLVLFIGHGYDSRTRTLLLGLSQNFSVSEECFVKEIEGFVLKELLNHASGTASTTLQRSLSNAEDRFQDNSKWSRKKWMYATAGVVVGAAACSLTAGLAAPVFLPAILSAVGISGAVFLSGTGGIALVATLFGIAGAGMASYRVSRRFADLKDFKFIPLKDEDRNRDLRVCITISGWIRSEADFTAPWIESYLENDEIESVMQSEVYCLSFEKDIMISLGRAIQDFLTSSAVTVAASQFLQYTVTAAASTALLFPVAMLQAGDLIDNPWTLGLDRARKAGKALAEALRKGAQGGRPVTLVGYSLGALVIFTCLQELARTALNELADFNASVDDLSLGGSESSANTADRLNNLSQTYQPALNTFGIIENVLLMGLPTHLPAPSVWNQLRLLVSGRFIHCYSQSDWVLKFLYRTSSPTASDIAGLGPIENSPSIENFDLSSLVLGHSDYQSKAAEIIKLVNL